MARYISLFLLILLPVFTLSCAKLSSMNLLGDDGLINESTISAAKKSVTSVSKALEDITPEQEYYIGRAVGANILTKYKIYKKRPEFTAYLNEICRTLTVNSPRPEIYNGYHVAILDTQEINAFATSGGHIFITLGLIKSTDSEDALAAIIAHEVAHILLQHGLKAIKSSRLTQALVSTGALAATVATQNTNLAELTSIFDESVNEIVTTMVNNGYSQSQEYDADENAVLLMAEAGYNPANLIDMLRALERNQPSHSGGFNSTHPSPTKRISSAEKTVNSQKVADTRSYRATRYKAIM